MSKRSKRMLSLLLSAGLVLIAPEALAWSWNQHQPRPYNGFESYSPGYGPSGYGYQQGYPRSHHRAYRPRYDGHGHRRHGYGHGHRRHGYGYGHRRHGYGYGYGRYFPGSRYYPGWRY